MPYSDFVVATPEPQLAILANLILPGVGTKLSSYYKDGGICFKTWGIGMLQNILYITAITSIYWWWFWWWVPFYPAIWLLIQFLVWAWA